MCSPGTRQRRQISLHNCTRDLKSVSHSIPPDLPGQLWHLVCNFVLLNNLMNCVVERGDRDTMECIF